MPSSSPHPSPTLKSLLADGLGRVRRAAPFLARAAAIPVVALMALSALTQMLAIGMPWGGAMALDLVNLVLGWIVSALFMAVCFRAYLFEARPDWRAVLGFDADERRFVITFIAITALSLTPAALVIAGFQAFSRSHNQVQLLMMMVPAFAAGMAIYFKLVLALPAALDRTAPSLTGLLSAAWRRSRGRALRLFAACAAINLPLICALAAVNYAAVRAGILPEAQLLLELAGTVVQLASTALIAGMVAVVHEAQPARFPDPAQGDPFSP